jgi:hypothetical protein
MRRLFISLVLACASLVGGAFSQTKQSQVGTWKLDVSQSDFGSEPAPKSATVIVLKDTSALLSWRANMIDDKGQDVSFSWSGPPDGSMHPVMQGGKEVSKQSAKKEADGTLHRHGEDPDGSSFDAYSKVSDDGNSMTDDGTSKAKDGKESKQKWVFHRVGAKGSAVKAGN